jgi:NTE family protein
MAGGLAVVLSGGGAKGAFQVGVLDALITQRGVNFELFVGVSTGAIQALGGAMNDMPGLLAEWRKLRTNADVYKDGGGVLGGVLGNDALFNAKPIRDKIKAFANDAKVQASGKKLRIGVVNLQNGMYRTIDESVPGIGNWVYASCAMPVYFEPLVTQDSAGRQEQWVDGGVREVTPLLSAMQENPRAILVVRASPKPTPPANRKIYDNLIKIGLRSVGIQSSEVSLGDTAGTELGNELLAARAAQAKALSDAGVTGAAAKKILKPIDDTISVNRIVPVLTLMPEKEFSETLEFDAAKIEEAITAGRKLVNDEWPKIKAFLRV